MMRSWRPKWLVVTMLLLLAGPGPSPVQAWSEAGHHIIALLAFDLLPEVDRARLLELLTHHPRYAEDFAPPPELISQREIARWRIGRAGYWPDIARAQPEFNRPTWHFQLAATLHIGEEALVQIPTTPGSAPESATLETQELHIAQALELCQRVLADQQAPLGDRALAASWLAHLVADAHQPCHAGSLYAERIFPEGDRGANSIPLKQGRNMHYLWDALLGDRYDAADARRRMFEITSDGQLIAQGRQARELPDGLEPLRWLEESRALAISTVYTTEVLEPVVAASRGLVEKVEQITLTEAYLQQAGRAAQVRATTAAYRLAVLWELAVRP